MIKSIVSLLLCVPLPALSQLGIISVGTLPGGQVSSARSVSPDGTYIVGSAIVNGLSFPYMWTRQAGMTPILVPDVGFNYNAQNVSHDGKYVTGGYSLDGGLGSTGYVWSQETGVVPLGSLPGGSQRSGVGFFGNQTDFAIGSASVGFTTHGASFSRAAKWTPANGLEPLPLPTPADADAGSWASYVLNDGRLVINAQSGTWLWSEDTGFENLPDTDGMHYISPDATFMSGTVINFDLLADNAAYWTPDTGIVILPLDGTSILSRVNGMSADGSLIVGVIGSEPVIWVDQGVPISIEAYAQSFGIDLSDWNIHNIQDISEDGTTIIGQARHNDLVQGYVLTIPAPASAIVLSVGLLSMRRRREE